MTAQIEAASIPERWIAREHGTPISGDGLRAFTYDPHPTQPFRMPDLLWEREAQREPIPTLRMNMALEYAHIRAILTN